MVLIQQRQALEQRIRILEKEKRRTICTQNVCVTKSGKVMVQVAYSDGYQETVPFIINFTGYVQVARLRCVDFKIGRAIAVIRFFDFDQTEGKELFVDIKKLHRATYLYITFLEAGIVFYEKLSEKKINDLLRKWISAMLMDTEQTYFAKVLAGWDTQSFRHMHRMEDNYNDVGICQFLEMPRKSFAEVEYNDIVDIYAKELDFISNANERCIVAVFPIVGLLYSLLYKNMGSFTYSLNLITISDFPVQVISSWMQIYDRNMLADGTIGSTTAEIDDHLSRVADEVVIVDARRFEGDTDYLFAKKKQVANRLREIVKTRRSIYQGRSLPATAVTVSSEFFPDSTLNIVLPECAQFDWDNHGEYLRLQVFEIVLSLIVNYVENNAYEIETAINQCKEKFVNNSAIFNAALLIFVKAWEKQGVDIASLLNIPKEMELESMIIPAEEDEILSIVYRIVRRSIEEYTLCRRRRNVYNKHYIYFDSYYMYIPTVTFRDMFAKYGYLNQLREAVAMLGQNDYLERTSQDSFVRKMQIDGVRGDYYAIEIDFFNQPGACNILDLAKEVIE